jgi:hypothetical protein
MQYGTVFLWVLAALILGVTGSFWVIPLFAFANLLYIIGYLHGLSAPRQIAFWKALSQLLPVRDFSVIAPRWLDSTPGKVLSLEGQNKCEIRSSILYHGRYLLIIDGAAIGWADSIPEGKRVIEARLRGTRTHGVRLAAVS